MDEFDLDLNSDGCCGSNTCDCKCSDENESVEMDEKELVREERRYLRRGLRRLVRVALRNCSCESDMIYDGVIIITVNSNERPRYLGKGVTVDLSQLTISPKG